MISRTTEYALRAVVFLARNEAEPSTAQRVAAGTGVPATYMSKILLDLGRAGLVRARRGVGGGFGLAVEPHRLAMLDVVKVFEPAERLERGEREVPDHGCLCPLHRRIDEATGWLEACFGRTTIADLLTPAEACPHCGSGSASRKPDRRARPRRERT